MKKRLEERQDEAGQLILLVNKVRADHPCMSAREIYFKIRPKSMGRDKFEAFCFAHGYRVKKRKNFRSTTDSRGVARFPNLVRDIEVTGVNQVLVSDITYYEMKGKFYYITLMMDLYNREIVGFSAGKKQAGEGGPWGHHCPFRRWGPVLQQ